MKFPHRYIARIIVEAETPLAIGSDNQQEEQDSPVAKDFNGLPYIPGTTLAGWLRKHNAGLSDFFGDKPDRQNSQDEPENKEPQGNGSNIVISDAYLLDDKQEVHQQVENLRDDAFLSKFYDLPIRQHVAIDYKGTAKEGSLFDREIVYKGSRFKFEIALELEEKNDNAWKKLLNSLYSDDFYIGGGQFDGFGELKVIEIKEQKFDLTKNLKDYLDFTVDLNNDYCLKPYTFDADSKNSTYDVRKYELTGENSFHHFGAGYGDTEVDHVNYREEIIVWDNGKPEFKEMFVIPATSIKGVLAHRTAFHFNKDNGITVEKLLKDYVKYVKEVSQMEPADTLEKLIKQKQELEKIKENVFDKIFEGAVYENNEAVKELFGTAKNTKTGKGQTGNVIIHDVFLDPDEFNEHIFYHNKIDRFTGGTVDGALYSEKVIHIDKPFDLIVKIIKSQDETHKTYKKYLNKALNDLTDGMLPAGGLVNKGHGFFNLKTENHDR